MTRTKLLVWAPHPTIMRLLPCLLLGLGFGLSAPGASAGNVVLVIADDMGVETLAAYGEQPIVARTPTLDALAAQGVLFRNAWAYPVCTPFRASLLTGRHPTEHGLGWAITILPEQLGVLDWQQPNLASLLADAGYRTAALGKWHLAREPDWGGYRDGVVSVTEAHPNLSGFAYFAGALFGAVVYDDWRKTVNGTTTITTTYATTDTANEAIAQLAGSEPFFLWVAFNAPHEPTHEPPSELLADPTIYDFELPGDRFRAMIEAMDTELGRIVAALDLSDTTLIFVADNGTTNSVIEPPLLGGGHGKTSVYEGGLNVPLIVAGEAVHVVAHGAESAALVQATDLFATVLDIAGVAKPARGDAISLLPYLMLPETPSLRQTVYSESFVPNGGPPLIEAQHNRAAREERYKLVRRGERLDQLYDLELDPYEQSPLSPASWTGEQAAAHADLDRAILEREREPIAAIPALTAPLAGALALFLCASVLAMLRWGRI